jgi:antitoxin ParD1/3/4
MPALTRHTVTLGARHQQFIERKLAQGEYASTSEVVRAGIAALAERDARIERWFQEEILPAIEQAKAHPETLIDAETLRARLFGNLEANRILRKAS